MGSKEHKGSHEPYEMDRESFGASRLLTYMLIAAGVAVCAWLLFTRPSPAPGPDQPPPVLTGQVTMTCTCRPAQ